MLESSSDRKRRKTRERMQRLRAKRKQEMEKARPESSSSEDMLQDEADEDGETANVAISEPVAPDDEPVPRRAQILRPLKLKQLVRGSNTRVVREADESK